jgi:hypothetical protein
MKIWINILVIVLALGVQSCANKLTQGEDKLPKIKEEQLIAALDSIGRSVPSFLSSRIDTKYSDNKQNISFKTSLKVNKDTAVHALITYAGLPMITAMVTTDSVKISNKREKCFIQEDLNFFKMQFGIDFSYLNLEELLLGRPLNFNPKRDYYIIHDPYNYILSTHTSANQAGSDKDKEPLLISYHLSPDLKYLKKVEITSFKDEVNIIINYSDYITDTLFSSPKNVNVEINTPKNKISLSMVYDKIELNVPKEMVFVIPESYEKCK